MAMSPGTYLRKRRQAAGLSIDQVARTIAALLAVTPHALAHQIEEIEGDAWTPDRVALQALGTAFALDCDVALRLIDRAICGPDLPEPQVCRACACSFHDPCTADEIPCAWIEPDLCSACVGTPGSGESAEPMPGIAA